MHWVTCLCFTAKDQSIHIFAQNSQLQKTHCTDRDINPWNKVALGICDKWLGVIISWIYAEFNSFLQYFLLLDRLGVEKSEAEQVQYIQA